MSSRGGLIALLLGLLFTAFGVATVHYTHGDDIQHHREWAEQTGMPAPGDALFWAGVVATLLGAGLIGYRFGRSGGRAD